jgi:AhpD family alkylhydroperoxidase
MYLGEHAPKVTDEIVDEGASEAFIPYPDLGANLANVPIYIRPDAFYYAARMGFFPNCNKLYLHVPWIAEHMWNLNQSIMRDERNSLDEHFKYRLAMIVSRSNECPYCTAHHAGTLKRRWEYDDTELTELLQLDHPQDEREAVAFEYVLQASLDPAGVTTELRARLAALFTPQEVMEIVVHVGFWKMYNAMHLAMALPIENPVLHLDQWVQVKLGNRAITSAGSAP